MRPRPLVFAAVLLAVAGTSLAGMAAEIPLWLLALALAAVGIGIANTGSLGLLVEAVPVERIVTAMVVWSQIGIVGYLLGPLAGGIVADGLGYASVGTVLSGRRTRSPAGEPLRERSSSDIIRAVSDIQLNDPQTLYRRWEDSQWSPFDVDLSTGQANSGQASIPTFGEIIYFALSSLMVAEERITTKFAGLVAGARIARRRRTFLVDPAGRRGAPHAVLRALPATR